MATSVGHMGIPHALCKGKPWPLSPPQAPACNIPVQVSKVMWPTLGQRGRWDSQGGGAGGKPLVPLVELVLWPLLVASLLATLQSSSNSMRPKASSPSP